jgi:virulence-associated protein VagC
MSTTHVFESNHASAVSLPPELGLLPGDEVEIVERNGEWIIRRASPNLLAAFTALASLPDDFMERGREDEYPPRERESLDTE